jgi:hypothetical protein
MKPLVQSKLDMAQIIIVTKSCSMKKFRAITPKVSSPQYGEFPGFSVCKFFCFYDCSSNVPGDFHLGFGWELESAQKFSHISSRKIDGQTQGISQTVQPAIRKNSVDKILGRIC